MLMELKGKAGTIGGVLLNKKKRGEVLFMFLKNVGICDSIGSFKCFSRSFPKSLIMESDSFNVVLRVS